MSSTLERPVDINLVDVPSIYRFGQRYGWHCNYQALFKHLADREANMLFEHAVPTESIAVVATDSANRGQVNFMTTLASFGYRVLSADFRLTRFPRIMDDPDVLTKANTLETVADVLTHQLGELAGYCAATQREGSCLVVTNDFRVARTMIYANTREKALKRNIALAFPTIGLGKAWQGLLDEKDIEHFDLMEVPGVWQKRE